MKKRVICLLLCAFMLLPYLTVRAEAANTAASAAANYLKKGDYIVISPAEKWKATASISAAGLKTEVRRVAVTTTEWELTAQHSGTANGNDIQTWKYGVSDKFYIENYEVRQGDGAGCFRIKNKGFRESGDGRFWDIEGRSKKPGGNLHLWEFKSGAASQWFYLEEDGDGDPETYFLKNRNSNLYLAPENYFEDPKDDCSFGRNSWWEEGCNVVQSNYAFRWRIQVLNRDAANDMGKTDKYANWMSLLPDDRYLSELNIPGTHDSSTTNVDGSWNASFNTVACQKYFIEQQLYAGVRALDLRTRWHDGTNDVVMVHGDFICHTPDHNDQDENKTFRSVLDTIIRYLDSHSTEAVIATLKIDSGDRDKAENALIEILSEYTNAHPDRFYCWTGNIWGNSFDSAQQHMTSPTLGDVRGKIVLMTRVDMSEAGDTNKLYSYTGPDLTKWDESYNHNNHYAQKINSGSNVAVYIQDDYESPDGNKKTQVFNTIYQLNGNLKQGDTIDKTAFVFNYTSKTTSDSHGLSPLGAAKYMNDILYNDSLFTPGTKEALANPRLGIVVMDYVNKQLCRRIIDRNDFPSSAAMTLRDYVDQRIPGGLVTAGQSADLLLSDAAANPTAVFSASSDMLISIENEVQTVPLEGAADSAAADEIVWPESAELTYGYVLGEATLHFADGAAGGMEGRFEFENAEKILPATKTGETSEMQTLKFISADGSSEETREIPVAVHRRYLPIKISDFEVEYGDTFSREALTEQVTVTAGGYLLADDLAALNETIQKYDIRWLLRDSEDNEIVWPNVPATDELASGTIGLRSEAGIDDPETEFPNYDASVELGTWEIVPRTVTVNWQWYGGSWHAGLGNILKGDNVVPVLENGALTLTGEQAGCYQIAEGDQTPPANPPKEPEKDTSSPASYRIRAAETSHGNIVVSGSRASRGETVTITATPDKGYALETLTVTDKNGKEVKLTEKNGKYTFTMPASSVTVTATFMDDNTMLNFFVDVKASDYFYDAVLWAAQNSITSGTDAVHFAPSLSCTRAQIATFLWRAAGSPMVNYAMNMTDVPGDAYYAEAVRWALSEGVTTGTTKTTFSPDESCTRAQAVTFLCRSQKAAAEGGMAVREFTDFDSIPAYAADAIQWALENHVTTGAGDGSFAPNAACTRAQIVTFLYRLHLSKQDAGH